MADYRIAVVDDDSMEAQTLFHAINKYFAGCIDTCFVDVYDGGARFVEAFDGKYDIIFLDVEMSPLDGMATARSIRLCDEQAVIVFVTHFGKYAVDGYAVNAFDYMIKPVVYDEFALKMPRIVREAARKKSKHIFIKIDRDMIKLNVDDILYVEVRNHDVYYKLHDKTYKVSGTTLKTVVGELGQGFIQCNSCYLVNMQHIQALRGDDFILTGGDRLAISRSRKKLCMKMFADYAGGV